MPNPVTYADSMARTAANFASKPYNGMKHAMLVANQVARDPRYRTLAGIGIMSAGAVMVGGFAAYVAQNGLSEELSTVLASYVPGGNISALTSYLPGVPSILQGIWADGKQLFGYAREAGDTAYFFSDLTFDVARRGTLTSVGAATRTGQIAKNTVLAWSDLPTDASYFKTSMVRIGMQMEGAMDEGFMSMDAGGVGKVVAGTLMSPLVAVGGAIDTGSWASEVALRSVLEVGVNMMLTPQQAADPTVQTALRVTSQMPRTLLSRILQSPGAFIEGVYNNMTPTKAQYVIWGGFAIAALAAPA